MLKTVLLQLLRSVPYYSAPSLPFHDPLPPGLSASVRHNAWKGCFPVARTPLRLLPNGRSSHASAYNTSSANYSLPWTCFPFPLLSSAPYRVPQMRGHFMVLEGGEIRWLKGRESCRVVFPSCAWFPFCFWGKGK